MTDHVTDIRARRDASNAAIARRDAVAATAIMTDDVIVAVAGGPILRGRAANRRAFAEQMAEPGFGGYVRTPASVELSSDGCSAAERGRWEGRWQVGVVVERQGGRYVAEWRLVDGEWCIAAETFVAVT